MFKIITDNPTIVVAIITGIFGIIIALINLLKGKHKEKPLGKDGMNLKQKSGNKSNNVQIGQINSGKQKED